MVHYEVFKGCKFNNAKKKMLHMILSFEGAHAKFWAFGVVATTLRKATQRILCRTNRSCRKVLGPMGNVKLSSVVGQLIDVLPH